MNNSSKESQWNKLSNKMLKKKITLKARHRKSKAQINKFLKTLNYKKSTKEINYLTY